MNLVIKNAQTDIQISFRSIILSEKNEEMILMYFRIVTIL